MRQRSRDVGLREILGTLRSLGSAYGNCSQGWVGRDNCFRLHQQNFSVAVL